MLGYECGLIGRLPKRTEGDDGYSASADAHLIRPVIATQGGGVSYVKNLNFSVRGNS